jgi:hypothetical protein
MKTASVKELREELKQREERDLVEVILRLSRFKKENKELLTYLLFESDSEGSYIDSVKTQVDELFLAINTSNIYYAKKGVRKVLREVKKYIRYSGNKETEVILLIHFCSALQESHPKLLRSKIIKDLVKRQVLLARVRVSTLHEDLQHDYERELNLLEY